LQAQQLQRGLTLIEMMVSIAIGLVVVGAVTYAYVGSKGSYRGNESLARIQEAGRFALDSMTKDVRRAGAMGCGSLSSITSNQPVVPSVIAPAGLVVSAIQGYTPAPNYTPLPLGSLPPGWTLPTPATGTAPGYWGGDVLQLQIASGVPARMSAGVDTANGNITIADNTLPNFKLNDYALVADCSSAAIFQITATPTVTSGTTTLLSYVTGGAVPALPPISVNTFPTVQHFDQVTYYLGKQPNGQPALYRYSMINGGTAEEVVDNVEDMDIVYGVDTTPTDPNISADLFEHADAVTAAGDWPNVVSVRVSLIAVGDQAGVAPAKQTFSVHGPAAQAVDTRLRQVFSASIALRDRLQ
jgi:type IV pilus assembly protein PilW